MPRRILQLIPSLVLAAAVLTAGCSGSGERTRLNQNLLTREEITGARLSNLFEVVERLRPRWLEVRNVASISTGAGQIVVYLNRSYLGGPSELRQFAPGDVQEVRYLDGPRASATLQGHPTSQFVAGAIVIITGGT